MAEVPVLQEQQTGRLLFSDRLLGLYENPHAEGIPLCRRETRGLANTPGRE